MESFTELGVSSQLKATLDRLGITKPTEIQAKSIKDILAGKDVIGESATGSGKTLAFGSGIIEKCKRGAGLQSIVLLPTRELALQVTMELKKLSNNALRVLAVYGGVSIEEQIHHLPNTDVVVATPGRLLDHLERRTIDITKVHLLVLDEADRMLDMGFIDDMEDIIRTLPTERQTLLFSATMPTEVKNLAKKYMKTQIMARAQNQVDPSKLKQIYYNIQRNLKLSLLIHELKNETRGLVMVFCNTRISVDIVQKNLKTNGINAIAIHGGFTQNKRQRTLEMFNDAKVGVLVCTDVAARGLHINNVSHVYNYEIPKEAQDYVHRIGRTARAGADGKVINFLSEQDYQNFGRVEQQYPELNIEKVKPPYVERVQIVLPPRNDRSSRGPSRGSSRGSFGNRKPFKRPHSYS
jgi:ATP-dependent RNA helicase DeaD